MTRRRKILLGLLVVAIAVTTAYFFWTIRFINLSETGFFIPQRVEALYLLFVVPVAVVNVWEWLYPEIMESYFRNRKEVSAPPKGGGSAGWKRWVRGVGSPDLRS